MEIENILLKNKINPTPVRILVLRTLENSHCALSMTELEIQLITVDKSSISRTLNLFRKKHLVHYFNDNNGIGRYEVCHSSHISEDTDTHVHFQCEICGETMCLRSLPIPNVNLPKGFIKHNINYIISGICKKCNTGNVF